MELRKIDRRTARTQAALRKALLELIAEKDYDAITVEEITARADLGRATFYLHFRDKDELLLDYFTEFTADRVTQFAQIPLSILGRKPDPDTIPIAEHAPIRPILHVFQHAADNAELYRIVMRKQGSGRIADRIQRIVTQSIDDLIRSKVRQEWLELQVQVDIDLLVHNFVGAFLASLTWWLENDMPHSPEEMARQFRILIFPGMRAALGMGS